MLSGTLFAQNREMLNAHLDQLKIIIEIPANYSFLRFLKFEIMLPRLMLSVRIFFIFKCSACAYDLYDSFNTWADTEHMHMNHTQLDQDKPKNVFCLEPRRKEA